jgi:release factor glutamine methyltransferase
MTLLHECVAQGRRTLVNAGISPDGAGLDAEVLARHVLGWDRAALLARGREPAPHDFAERYAPLIVRRAAREPVAMIVGHREFWGLEFEVTPNVLIPRPETEFVVDEVLEYVRGGAVISRLVDVGTGTGCLAVSLATELQSIDVVATDMSAEALEVARRNALRHKVDARVHFMEADLLTGVHTSADVIVSNPPYVPLREKATLQPEVGTYEPAISLFGGGDGLVIMRRLLASAGDHLVPGGRLIVEFGDGQEMDVCAIAEGFGWEVLGIRNDLQGIARVASLRKRSA